MANRVISLLLKVDNHDALTQHFQEIHQAVCYLFKQFVIWSQDSVMINDEEVSFLSERDDLYKSYGEKLGFSKECFTKMLKILAYGYKSKWKVGDKKKSISKKGATSSLFGRATTQDAITEDEINALSIHSFTSNDLHRVSYTLKQSGFFDQPFLSSKALESDGMYVVAENVYRKFSSWLEVNAAAKENYGNIEIQYQNLLNNFNDKERKEIGKLVIFCDENDIMKRFDIKFMKWLELAVIPALEDDEPNSPLSYISRDDKKNKNVKVRYSLDPKFYEYLKNNSFLWSNEESKKKLLKYGSQIFSIRHKLLHNKNYANCPIPNIKEPHVSGLFLGDNFFNYKFEYEGKDSFQDVYEVSSKRQHATPDKFSKGTSVDHLFVRFGKNSQFRARIFIRDQYYNGRINPSAYFQDLAMWSCDSSEKSKKKSTYLLQFTRHQNEIHRCFIREPSIELKYNKFYIRMNLDYFECDNQDIIDFKWLFNSAYPTGDSETGSKSDKGKNNRERLKGLTNKEFNVMGVDLGLRNIYSYAIGKVKVVGKDSPYQITATGTNRKSKYNSEFYSSFKKELDQFRSFIAFTKECTYKDGDTKDPTFTPLIKSAQLELAKRTKTVGNKNNKYWSAFSNMSIDDIIHDIKNNAKKDIKGIKRRKNWIGNFLIKYIKYRFYSIKEDRKMFFKEKHDGQKIDNEFNWLECIKYYRSAISTLSYLGTEDRVKPNFDALNEYYKNTKKNLLNHIASSIVKTAIENECSVICLERFGNGNNKNARRENFLLSHWSPASIKETIESAAAIYQIHTAEVNEFFTSQVHNESGLIGFREDENLYVEIDDKLVVVDADINAAKNILQRFICRHSDLNYIPLSHNTTNDEEKELGKQVKGTLAKHNISLSELKKIYTDQKCVYRHSSGYLTSEELKTYRSELEEKITQRKTQSKQMSAT